MGDEESYHEKLRDEEHPYLEEILTLDNLKELGILNYEFAILIKADFEEGPILPLATVHILVDLSSQQVSYSLEEKV